MIAGGAIGCGSSPSDSLPTHTAVSSPEHRSAIDSARTFVRGAASRGAGVSVAVASEGELVWLEGAGFADLEGEVPVDPEITRFRIYSVSKPMTAVAAARLMERGRLDPSAPVQRYVDGFPEHPEHPEPITAMQLATHTSGIRHYAGAAEANSLRHCQTVDDALAIFQDDPLVHPPGSAETYSSWGYVVLSGVIEGVTDSSFPSAMESLVLEPAGMTRTTLDDPTRQVGGRAIFYDEREGRTTPARAVDNTCKWGAGAYVSTAADIARFGAAMLDPDFLSPSSLELFMEGRELYRAQGLGTGGAAFLAVDRSASVAVALLSNAIGEEAGPAAQEAARRIHELFTAEG